MKITVYPARLLVLSLLFSSPAFGQAAMPVPNWDRALAVESTKSIDTDTVLKSLYHSARTGDSRQVLDTLLAVEQNDDWPVPAREYVIWSFTLGLADLAVNAVSPGVLEYLSAYDPQTLVAHDDRASVGVPLFNIRTAAAGLSNSWARRRGADRAERLFQEAPALWINTYLDVDPATRRGFTDALDYASDEQLHALAQSAIGRLADQPGLTAVVGKSALILGDYKLLQHTLIRGSGPELHRVLGAASMSLDAEESKALLFQAIHQAPVTTAGLAIAQLAPALLDDPAVREKLFGMLASRELGSSAAMILASSTDPDIRSRLEEIASGKESLATQRASLARLLHQSSLDQH